MRDGDRVVDEVDTRIGIRSIRFDNDGLWINEEKLIATGANRHQEFPYVGYAIPVSVQYRDIKKLAEDLVQFEVSGEGEIVGDESIGANPMRAEAGVASVLIRSTHRAGKIEVRARAFGLSPATLQFESMPLTSAAVP